ncbi:MAG: SDR family oxidoreductase [Spirochaetia bacterium]|nr:SDR family oxidoreductase [Spirochaetia bacterium]
MKDSVVLITGAAGGIGRYLTGAFLNSGSSVVACDLDAKAIEKIAKAQKWDRKNLKIEKLDVRSEKQWQSAIKSARKAWGKLDILINNAGYLLPGYVHTLDEKIIDLHLNINAKGVMLGTAAAARVMLEQRHGHIINIASLAGIAGIPGISAYSASKHAVRGFTLAASQELRAKGVYVTVICPDAVQTPMLDLQKDYAEAALTFSGGKVLTPADVEGAIRTALLKKSREITIPGSRGMLAKIASAFPAFTSTFASIMEKQGKRNQSKFRKQS